MRRKLWSMLWGVLGPALFAAPAGAVTGGDGVVEFTGRVVDPNGNPVSGVSLQLTPDPTGGMGDPPLAATTTDSRGLYHLAVPAALVADLGLSTLYIARTQDGLSLPVLAVPVSGGGQGSFWLIQPWSCREWPSGTQPTHDCQQLNALANDCALSPGDPGLPAGWQRPNVCDPNWVPPAPPPPRLPPILERYRGLLNGYGGARNAPTAAPAAGSGPFAPSGGGQAR